MGRIKINDKAAQSQLRLDNWVNCVTGLGDLSRDKAANGHFAPGLHKSVQYYETLFAEDPIAHRIAALPPGEALRQGFALTGVDNDLKKSIEQRYNDLDADNVLIEVMAFGRALGGAAVWVIVHLRDVYVGG